MFVNNSITIPVKSWFIPVDILVILCNTVVIGLAILFLFVIIFTKTCHTVPMMLVANSCVAELLLGSDILWMAVFSLQNDLKQIQYQDSFCIFRGYLSYSSCALQNYSFLLQSIYRYSTVVYPTRLFCQSTRMQIFFVASIWIFTFTFSFPFIYTGEITYNIDNQVCQIPLELSFALVFVTLFLYVIPVLLIMFIYLKLVRYVKEISQHITPVNTLNHAQRELKMVHRIILLLSILLIFGLPYTIFIVVSFFTNIPKYHFRIVVIFIDASLVVVMIVLFVITEPLKTSIMKIINGRLYMIVPILT